MPPPAVDVPLPRDLFKELFLFLSIDVSGSTAFKRTHIINWMDAFQNHFFSGASAAMDRLWLQHSDPRADLT